MSDEIITRTIELSRPFFFGPVSWLTEDGSGEELHLSAELVARIDAWCGMLPAGAPDWEKDPSALVEEMSPAALDEGAKIAQLIADEMGPDVPVVFEGRRFVSFSPPTNSPARQALEDYISLWHPGMNEDVREMWWAADWPRCVPQYKL